MFEACDRCGHRAYVQVMNASNGELALCKHHYEQHEAALILDGWLVVLDERAMLVPVIEAVKG